MILLPCALFSRSAKNSPWASRAATTPVCWFCSIVLPNRISLVSEKSNLLIGKSFSITSAIEISCASAISLHCSSVNGETKVLRSWVKCPPTSNFSPKSLAIARMYVPAEQLLIYQFQLMKQGERFA